MSRKQFFNHFPGPYSYVPDRDGVDDTFDVICTSTGRHVISTYYWHERQPAELVARVVTAALNDLLVGDGCFVRQLGDADLNAFRQSYPGPYTIRRSFCDYRGPCFLVNCQTSGECVIHAVGGYFRREARIVSRQVATGLNTAFASPVSGVPAA